MDVSSVKNSPSNSGTPDPRDALFDTTEVEKGLKRKTAAASFLILTMAALKTVQQFAAIAILARLIPPSEYGIYALVVPAVMLGMALSTFGLGRKARVDNQLTRDNGVANGLSDLCRQVSRFFGINFHVRHAKTQFLFV